MDGFVLINCREPITLGQSYKRAIVRCLYITNMPHKTPKPRSLTGIDNPTPQEIKRARLKAGFSIREAATSVLVSTATWKSWERPYDDDNHRPMHPAFALLFAYQSGLSLPPNTEYIDPTKAPD